MIKRMDRIPGQPLRSGSFSRGPSKQLLSALAISGLFLALVLSGCGKEHKAATPEPRPVRTITVRSVKQAETLSLTGEIKPRYQADIGFRISGKILRRPVDVGTQVEKGSLLAELDPAQYKQDLVAATAQVAAADAEVVRSQAQEARQAYLLKNGHTTRVEYDLALKNFKTAQAQAEAARARQTQDRDNLGYTELKSDEDGVVTAVGADAGQVVAAGQMIVRLAKPGEREAVFNVAEAAFKRAPRVPSVEVHLASNPEVKALGTVRYVSPQADPVTRTFTVRVSLPKAPPEMRLGANVVGTVTWNEGHRVVIPGTALFEKNGKPAVWVIRDGTVRLKSIDVERYQSDSIIVAGGLANGDVVVIAGVNTLLPGQKVRLLQASTSQ